MLICEIFLLKFIHKVSGPLIAIVIIQIFSKTPRANWEMLKNEKYTCSSKDYICRKFYHTSQLLNVSLKSRVGKMPAFKSKVHATGVYWHFPE